MRRVINDFERPSADLVQGFRGLLDRYSPSCIVSDVLERSRTLSSSIRPAVPGGCGGWLVGPGDIILADAIGVVAVPQREAAEVLRRALLQADQEEATRQRIKAGKTVDELLAEFGRL